MWWRPSRMRGEGMDPAAKTQPGRNMYRNSKILITGGTGSIGLVLAESLLTRKPGRIILFTNDENGLFEARVRLAGEDAVEYKLGDVRDREALREVARGCDYVFHAAALKHVDFCESNPIEAVSTNILGTQNVIDAAVTNGVRRMVFISTDKAVNPISTMGATKLLGERLVSTASRTSGPVVFSTVRFGNVFGSRGSVVSVFERQVREGSAITVTNPEMTRFAISPLDAARLVLRAAEEASSGEIFVLKMESLKISDLAEASRQFFGKLYGKAPGTIPVKTIGSKPGEKLHEELMTDSEAVRAVEIGDFYVINPARKTIQAGKPVRGVRYTSNKTRLLTVSSIRRMLQSLYDARR